MPRKITIEQVKDMACREAIEAFRAAFGEEVEVTEENLKRLPEILYEPMMVMALLRRDSALKMPVYDKHTLTAPGPHCPGCVAEMKAFIQLYNEEQEDEGLLGSGERAKSPESPSL